MDRMQDLTENTPFPLTVNFESHATTSPPPPPVASSSNAEPSSSLTLPQLSGAVTHIASNLPHYYADPARHSIRPGWSPETGLPREIWLHVIDILFRNHSATALLACALTCKYLHAPAQELITRLNWRGIRSWIYDDIDQFVDDVRRTPRDAKLVTELEFFPEGRDDESVGSHEVLALSIAPLRLAGQRTLKNLKILNFESKSAILCHFHPRSCPLYGRAFPTVTKITMASFQFPSFMDFAFFVASFPALASLTLWSVSCRNQTIPLSVARGPKKRDLQLKSLDVRGAGTSCKWFVATFMWWLLRRCGRLPENIHFTEPLFDHPWGREVLHKSSESLVELSVFFDSETRMLPGHPAGYSWLGECSVSY